MATKSLTAPTILVGVGGIGREIIEEFLSILILKKISLQNKLSIHYIDTDAHDVSELEYELQEHAKELNYSYSVTLCQALSDTSQTAKDILSTLPIKNFPLLPDNIPVNAEQASANRALGFLFFLKHIYETGNSNVVEKIVNDIERFSPAKAQMNGMISKEQFFPTVFVVGSLYGGSGAGMILPIAALIRARLEEKKIESTKAVAARIAGIFPDVSACTKGNRSMESVDFTKKIIHARHYSTLKEINYFQTPNRISPLEIPYPNLSVNEEHRIKKVSTPPFDNIFLISDKTFEGKLIQTNTYKFFLRGIANFILITTTNQRVRSDWANNSQEANYRYSTFGFYELSPDRKTLYTLITLKMLEKYGNTFESTDTPVSISYLNKLSSKMEHINLPLTSLLFQKIFIPDQPIAETILKMPAFYKTPASKSLLDSVRNNNITASQLRGYLAQLLEDPGRYFSSSDIETPYTTNYTTELEKLYEELIFRELQNESYIKLYKWLIEIEKMLKLKKVETKDYIRILKQDLSTTKTTIISTIAGNKNNKPLKNKELRGIQTNVENALNTYDSIQRARWIEQFLEDNLNCLNTIKQYFKQALSLVNDNVWFTQLYYKLINNSISTDERVSTAPNRLTLFTTKTELDNYINQKAQEILQKQTIVENIENTIISPAIQTIIQQLKDGQPIYGAFYRTQLLNDSVNYLSNLEYPLLEDYPHKPILTKQCNKFKQLEENWSTVWFPRSNMLSSTKLNQIPNIYYIGFPPTFNQAINQDPKARLCLGDSTVRRFTKISDEDNLHIPLMGKVAIYWNFLLENSGDIHTYLEDYLWIMNSRDSTSLSRFHLCKRLDNFLIPEIYECGAGNTRYIPDELWLIINSSSCRDKIGVSQEGNYIMMADYNMGEINTKATPQEIEKALSSLYVNITSQTELFNSLKIKFSKVWNEMTSTERMNCYKEVCEYLKNTFGVNFPAYKRFKYRLEKNYHKFDFFI